MARMLRRVFALITVGLTLQLIWMWQTQRLDALAIKCSISVATYCM